MADEVKLISRSSMSFSIKSKKARKSIIGQEDKAFDNDAPKELSEDTDFIVTVEESGLQSAKPKKEKEKLVIPLIKKNNWRIPGSEDGVKSLDDEAANEILKELSGKESDRAAENLAIPLLMRNRLPTQQGKAVDEKYDISLRPEESSVDDYDNVPVEAFGAAMLRGMGWEEGKPIGLTNRGLVEPIEYIPRFKGLGLGAEKKPEEKKQRKRKPGDPKETRRIGPIIEKDGKVRHVKGVGEEIKDQPKGYFPGAYALLDKGPHKNMYGKIVAVDEDNARVTIKLALSGELTTSSQYNVTLVDKDEYQEYAKVGRKKDADDDENFVPSKRKREDADIRGNEHQQKQRTKEDTREIKSASIWLMPQIRVRLISKSYKKGRYYNKKVKIMDIISRDTCICRTDDGKVLEDIRQEQLETVVPKQEGALVLIVAGKYKGQVAKIIERRHSKCQAQIQLLSNKHLTKVDYHSISEYLGETDLDEFL